MKQNLHNIFNNGDCLSSDDMQLYLRGSMSPEDANAFEQHMEGCNLCADAIEGLQAFGNVGKLDDINANLDLKVDELLQEDKRSVLFSGWYKIAAAVAILVMVGGVLYVNNQFSNKNQKVFTEHYKPFEKKEDKDEPIRNESNNSAFSENEPSLENESEKEIVMEDAANAVVQIPDDNFKSLEAEPATANRNKFAVPTAPPAISMVDELNAEVAEEQEDLKRPTEGMMAADDADVINVRGGRSNSEDNYVDGIKVQDDKNNEVATMQSDKMESVAVIEEVTVAKDSKSKKTLVRKENKNEAQVQQSTAMETSKEAFFNGANTELITLNFTKGEEEYKNKNYEQASLWFQKALELDAGHYQSNFYTGLCALQLDQAKGSVDYLKKVIEKEKEVLYEPALWYLSLAHIKLDESRKAKKYLKMIIPLNGEYKIEAEKLLKDL